MKKKWLIAIIAVVVLAATALALLVNVFWAAYNVRALLVIVRAAGWSPPPGWHPRPPLDGAVNLPR